MAELITEQYRQACHELYLMGHGASSGKWVDTVFAMIVGARSLHFKDRFHVRTVLDYGCGQGQLRQRIRHRLVKFGYSEKEIAIREYDPAVPEKATLPKRADMIVCTDVLEHIEPKLLGNVLDHLHMVTIKFALIGVSLKLSSKELSDGRNAHLIIKSTKWWLKRLKNAGDWQVGILPTARNPAKYVTMVAYR